MCLQKKQERDKRKELAAMKAKSQKDLELIQIIKVSNLTLSYTSLSLSLSLSLQSRGVTLCGAGEDDEGLLEIDLNSQHPAGARVHLAEDGALVWPVLLLYPEYNQSDYIAEFREHDRFIDHLREMFQTPAPWDVEGKYPVQAMQVTSIVLSD